MELQAVTCVRFSIQLLVSESVFLLWRTYREPFPFRLAVSLTAYAVSAGLWFGWMKMLPWTHPLVRIFFYIGLFALTLLAMRLSFDLLPIEVLFVGTGGYATEHIAYSLAKIVQYLTGGYEDRLGVVLENILFRFLPYFVVAGVVWLLIIRGNRGREMFEAYDFRLTLLAMGILSVAVVVSVFCGMEAFAPQGTIVTEVLCPIYGGTCCLLSLLLEYHILRENSFERERKSMEEALQLANGQRERSKEAINIINMRCHELKRQIAALGTMNDAGEREEYVSKIQQEVSIYDAVYHTGCEALDYILQEKTLLSNERHAAFSCMADGAAVSFMRPADIYALMGNALDNALEQVSREPEERRIISLRIQRKGRMVLIHLENQCSTEVMFQDGLPVTDKADKGFHGFGVKSIRYIAEKYDGQVLMRRNGGMFVLDVLLPGDGCSPGS